MALVMRCVNVGEMSGCSEEVSIQLEEISLSDEEVEKEETQEHGMYFWVGFVFTLVVSFVALLGVIVHSGMRTDRRKFRKYVFGVMVASAVHAVVVSVVLLVMLVKHRYYL